MNVLIDELLKNFDAGNMEEVEKILKQIEEEEKF